MKSQAKLYCYMDGWRDGAYGKMASDKYDSNPQEKHLYESGHQKGRRDRGAEMARVAEGFGASLNVLRAMG